MRLAPATRLGHFQVVASIGAGGMGEVYRAIDVKLGRTVALKVLSAQVAADADRLARFQREARTIASLNHPHIVTIYSVDEIDGVHLLTMELVEGQSLDRLIPEGGLAADRILDIGEAIAEALVAAHDKEIVHRDLKPANVMVTPAGRIKVLDFGLAKDMHSRDSTQTTTSPGQTAVGILMGTPAYMSPEQVAGRAVDHRSDLFSLGVILYEMAHGRRPFEGASSAELASAILRDTPPPLVEIRSDLPVDFSRVVGRCLEKDPDRRIQTTRDVMIELHNMRQHRPPAVAIIKAANTASDIGSGAVRKDEGFWVAVLPFKYRGSDPSLESLADGLSEEIVTGLSRFAYLRVIARGSTLRYATQATDVRTVGAEIGARYVMEGSVRQAGSTLRLAVQLVDATTGAHLWAETYDRSFQPDAVFELQDELVPRAVSTIADWYGILPRSMSEAVRGKPANELSPYEALLRSFGYYDRVVPEEHAIVRPILERAVEHSPGHPAAWAMLSMLYGEEYRFGFNAAPDALGRSLRAARRAIDAAPSSHISHLALAQAHYFRKELDVFRTAAERALSLNPMDGATIEYLAHLLAFAGDWERGSKLAEHARQLNPNHPAWYWALPMLNAYRKGDYQAALVFLGRAHMPGQAYSQALFASVLGQLGDREASTRAVRELLALQPDFAKTARDQFGRWYLPDLVEHLIGGLRKAGLEVPQR